MKRLPRIIWYYIEIYFIKLILLFGIKRNTSVIPEGLYCYTPIESPTKDNNYIYKIKPCKYYRHITKNIKSCTYEGFVGFDFCLYDQCKICGEKDDIREDELI